MRRTNVRARGFAAAMVAAGIVAGPLAGPAVAADSIREQQWHLDLMKASEIWAKTKGQGITVAVIDGGFNLEHPDLVGQLLPGKDFSGLPGGVGTSEDGHGTGISSLIAGSGKGLGGKGAYGLAPGAKVLPLKIKNDSNAGKVAASEFFNQIGQAIAYAADQGAKIINISQGGTSTGASDADMAALRGAVSHAAAKGVLVVASVGNSAQSGNPVEFPGALPGVLGVGAVDQSGWVTPESEQGAQVDIAAPGLDMYGACIASSGYCKTHGTSDASAIVSAAAALLWSVHPDWSANQIARVLINTAGKPTDGSNRNDIVGYGIVRPRVALTEPGDPGPADVYPIQEQPVGQPTPSTAPTPSAPASPSAEASAAQPAPTPPPSASAAPVAAQEDKGSPLVLVAAVVGGLVLVAGVVVLLLRRRGAPHTR
ncbi:type VII secretion-associated serine protease mycosin [Kitasatospora purpeofusca]|uniref:type VII secretion-associated serine protease mycosin n=1 Tax=Kitasatospora purpeofusca TaxID=67352 RepID=UPI003669B8B8